jgi:hypothetical protein
MIRTSTGLGATAAPEATGLPWHALQKKLAEAFGGEAPVASWQARAHARLEPQRNVQPQGNPDEREKAGVGNQERIRLNRTAGWGR